ncbi:neprilysin-1-like isoform X2 [Octopus vulgaris]|uniref:Neprilysin-1-like isoform X2 n=2 Tax=Octopus TaxID=6643 RepID=A0AA36FPP1_OCTVU|nr:neprilysin-1-like isoform X2 [Octopus vulgaris]
MEESGLETTTKRGNRPFIWLEMRTVMISLCILATGLGISLVVILSMKNQKDPQQLALENLCLTKDCVKAAARLMDAMNTKVDPCDNFYDFACGSWKRLNPIPEDSSSYSTFEQLRNQLQSLLKDLLESEISDEENISIQKAKILYSSCMNKSLLEDRDLSPLRIFLDELGGWPVVDINWNESNFNLYSLMSKLRLYNNNIFVYMWVSTDEKNSSTNIIQIDQGDLGMPSADYFTSKEHEDKLNAYKKFAENVAITLGATSSEAEKQIEEAIKLEIQIANITEPSEGRRDYETMYKKFTIEELTNKLPEFDWLKYLTETFSAANITLTTEQPVVVYALDFLTNLVQILKVTPKKTLANYLVWRIIMNRVNNLPKKYRDMKKDYHERIFGQQSETPRWRECATFVADNLGNAIGRLFIANYFDEEAKKSAKEMIHNIREAFNELLHEVEWMDSSTIEVAQEKANAIVERIGYPPYILNDTVLTNMYYHVDYQADFYFENVLTTIRWNAMINLKQLGQPVDNEEWLTPPAVVNAFYSSTKNEILFPAGILQPPFYSKGYPKFMNYGGIGMVIGHEITHGFDDKGRQYDKDGNLKQWWDDVVIERFKNQTQCMIEQYGNYLVPEANMNLNGIITQGENIADNGGLKQAFRAYEHWKKKTGGKEQTLPGLSSYTPEQMFFLNFAHVWCGSMRREAAINRIQTNHHSPGRFRVIGPLQNSPEFSQVFNCKQGSYMNPEQKCTVW